MRTLRILAACCATVIASAGAVLVGASSASAADTDQIWYQSVARASQDTPCPESDPADLTKGWTKWTASYEAWPNGGKGGWTCTRSILWAKAAPRSAGGGGCLLAQYNPFYLQFGSSNALPYGTQAYSDAGCGVPAAGAITSAWYVFAPNQPAAQVICTNVGASTATPSSGGDPRVWYCF